LRLIGVASNSLIGRHSAKGECFTVIAMVNSVREEHAIYKVVKIIFIVINFSIFRPVLHAAKSSYHWTIIFIAAKSAMLRRRIISMP